jgi:hypothetical protein
VGAYGLQTHIWNNNWKTVLLMAGFPVLLLLLTYAVFLLFAGLTGTYYGNDPMTGYFIGRRRAGAGMAVRDAGALVWFSSPTFSTKHHRRNGALGRRSLNPSSIISSKISAFRAVLRCLHCGSWRRTRSMRSLRGFIRAITQSP